MSRSITLIGKLRMFWLSYADDEGFRGGCYVDGIGFVNACARARAFGLSPGGQVAGVELPADFSAAPLEKNRLYTESELLALDGADVTHLSDLLGELDP